MSTNGVQLNLWHTLQNRYGNYEKGGINVSAVDGQSGYSSGGGDSYCVEVGYNSPVISGKTHVHGLGGANDCGLLEPYYA